MDVTIKDLVGSYGLRVVIVALVSIFIVGCIKVLFARGFKRLGSGAKPIYETLSIIVSVGLAGLWLIVKAPWFGLAPEPFTIESFIKQAALVYAAVKIMYPIYENYKLRDLVRLIGRLIKGIFGKEDKVAVDTTDEKKTIVI